GFALSRTGAVSRQDERAGLCAPCGRGNRATARRTVGDDCTGYDGELLSTVRRGGMKRLATRTLFCTLGLLLSVAAHAVSLEAFFKAAASDDVATLRDLLARGMPPDATDPQGDSALMYAARAGSVEASRLLLTRG